MSKQRKLLFFITDWGCSEKTPVSATLAWLTKEKRMLFDIYIQKYAKTPPLAIPLHEIAGPYFNAFHAEQFYYLCNCFDVRYCSIGARRFLRDLKTFGKEEVSVKKKGQLFEFYREVFSYFGKDLPKTAVMVRTEKVKDVKCWSYKWFTLELLADPYCFPEIYYRKALGLPSEISRRDLAKFYRAGVKTIYTLYCRDGTIEKLEEMGFEVKIIDKIKETDSFESISSRVADRWLGQIKGISYADPILATFWLPYFARYNIMPLFGHDGLKLVPKIVEYADKMGTDIVWGRQAYDDFITELSKYGKIMQVVDHLRPALTVKDRVNYAFDYLKPRKAPWSAEYSDKDLENKVANNEIAVTLIFYAADLRHFTGLPRLLDVISATKGKIGLAITTDWYDYTPEFLEDILIPVESGGTFPLVEILLGSAGLGIGTEAKNYLPEDKFLSFLIRARENMARKMGKEFVPKGHYPWQDTNPCYKNDAVPQLEVIKRAGFEYCITQKDASVLPKIAYQDEDFIALNQQLIIEREKLNRNLKLYFAVLWAKKQYPLNVVKECEEGLDGGQKPGWIIIGVDTPFWTFHPYYIDYLRHIKNALEYIVKGGKSKKLFTATPHEIARYAKILRDRGRLE